MFISEIGTVYKINNLLTGGNYDYENLILVISANSRRRLWVPEVRYRSTDGKE
jgi:hypothetical protein